MTPPFTSRRVFLGQAGFTVGAAVLATRGFAQEAVSPAPATGEPKVAEKVPGERTLQAVVDWTLAATRFVDPPTWAWKPFPGAAAYVVMVAGAGETEARTIRLKEPRYDMARDWASLQIGPVSLIAWAEDEQGRALCAAWPNAAGGRRFYKSPDFDGVVQKPLDWRASAERCMAYLLAPARDKVHAFEGDMPRLAWSCCEESITGQRRLTAFPALHYPGYIFAYHLFAEEFPRSPLAPVARQHARRYGDWLLEHRQPAGWRCGLFPFSTIENGKFEGHLEGKNITLFRAARVGEAMVDLFRQTGEKKYLAYAHHLADVFVDLQRSDGSWPFRVDPKDGRVVAEYTSAAITPARLMGLLEQVEPNATYSAARAKAAQWVLENPVRTRRWQGMYEDVAAQEPFRNLHHWDTHETISYLLHYRPRDPASIAIAEGLNRYVEDQFVLWQPDDHCVIERVPTPTALEQYACYRPMEVHTAHWIRTLLALDRATGKEIYLQKATSAANSILRAQAENGAYSTWGYDVRFRRPLLTMDWPGCNAEAVRGLLELVRYTRDVKKARAGQPAL